MKKIGIEISFIWEISDEIEQALSSGNNTEEYSILENKFKKLLGIEELSINAVEPIEE